MNNTAFWEEKKTFKQWMKEHQVGLYITLIAHLCLFIILTVNGIHQQLTRQAVYIFDFSKDEKPLEEKIEEEKLTVKEQLEKEVEEMIRTGRRPEQEIRNVAVNTYDRQTNRMVNSRGESDQVLAENQALQARLDATRQKVQQEQKGDLTVPETSDNTAQNDKPAAAESYKGPSVISYTLDGRRAMSLPVPVYKCRGGGDVTVGIAVNRMGYVLDAWVEKRQSANDDCLHHAAVQAARTSRFTADKTADEPQKGEIVYRFIAQ